MVKCKSFRLCRVNYVKRLSICVICLVEGAKGFGSGSRGPRHVLLTPISVRFPVSPCPRCGFVALFDDFVGPEIPLKISCFVTFFYFIFILFLSWSICEFNYLYKL